MVRNFKQNTHPAIDKQITYIKMGGLKKEQWASSLPINLVNGGRMEATIPANLNIDSFFRRKRLIHKEIEIYE